MANDFSQVLANFAPIVQEALRERVALPAWVDLDTNFEPAQKGDTIPFYYSVPVNTRDVSPGVTGSATSDITPIGDSMKINLWREAPMRLTFKQLQEVNNPLVKQQVQQAVRSVINYLDGQLIAAAYSHSYSQVSAYRGTNLSAFTVGTAPLAAAQVYLDNALAPEDERTFIFSPDVKANIQQNSQFIALTNQQPLEASVNGNLGRLRDSTRMHWSQNIPSVAFASLSQTTVSGTAGTKSAAFLSASSQTLNAGTTFKRGTGDTQNYVVTDTLQIGPNASSATIEPAWATSPSSGSVTFDANYTLKPNLLIHRNAIKLVMRPGVAGPSDVVVPDPLTGLPVVLTTREEHYQNYMAVSILGGIKAVYPAWIARLEG